MKFASLCVASVIAFSTGALAQTSTEPAATPAPNPAAPTSPATPPAQTVPADENLEPGANSFTEAQARSWLEEAGYTNVSGLAQSKDGIWRGHALRNGTAVNVAVDYKGTISVD